MKFNRFDIKRLNTREFRSFLKSLNKLELNEVRSYIEFQKNKANVVWKNVKDKIYQDDSMEKDAILEDLYWSNKHRILMEEGNRRLINH